jgi:WD40 repeat protein
MEIQPYQSFGMINNVIKKNLEFVTENEIVYVSGCNIVCFDLNKKESKFITRKSNDYHITSLSVAYKTKEEPLVCIGEYNEETKKNQISIYSLTNPKNTYTLTRDDLRWKVTTTMILKNSTNIVALSRKEGAAENVCKLSFWKYTQEKFISEVPINETVNYITFNPENFLELLICGKGYLRKWNLFINEGTLKEHPQRFLKGKQEKEHNFIRTHFFENKSFKFIVGSQEGIFYIIDNFQIIHVFDIHYREVMVRELSIQMHDLALEDIILKSNNIDTESTIKSQGSYNSLTSTRRTLANPLFNFVLFNNSHLLLTYANDPITLIRELEQSKHYKLSLHEQPEDNNTLKDKPEKKEYIRNIYRISKQIKQVLNVIHNPSLSKIIYMVELHGENNPKCLYVFNRKGEKGDELVYEREIFKEFFINESIKSMDINQRRKIILTLTESNYLRCWDYNNFMFMFKHKFKEPAFHVKSCQHNNIFGVCFEHKFTLFAFFKDKIKTFVEFDISNSYARFSKNGQYIAIAGKAVDKNVYNIHFVDTMYFNTVHVLEDIPYKVRKIKWINNDQYLVVLLDNSFIYGWKLNLTQISVTLMNRLKDYGGKNISQSIFSFAFRHIVKQEYYTDFEYDTKNKLLVLIHNRQNKLTICNKDTNSKSQVFSYDFDYIPMKIKILLEDDLLVVGTNKGGIKIYSWPFELANDGLINLHLISEVTLHTAGLNNFFFTDNMKNLITTSYDGSIYVNKVMTKRKNKLVDFSYFDEKIIKLAPKFEVFTKLSDIYQYKISEIRKKDQKAKILQQQSKEETESMKTLKQQKIQEFEIERFNIEEQKRDAIEEEEKKAKIIQMDIALLAEKNSFEVTNKKNEHEAEKKRLNDKYKNKLSLYQNEITRLKLEINNLHQDIEEKFKILSENKSEGFKKQYEAFITSYDFLKKEMDSKIKVLVKQSIQYDGAIHFNKDEYEEIFRRTEEQNTRHLNNLKKELADAEDSLKRTQMEEHTKKMELDKKINESNLVIEKNAKIKQDIILTTQRTITLQEQLLETSKNIEKIKHKFEDLTVKNKHLEQIRFVLEHRMTSLEKEKAPLEGQCQFLEKQKTNLQEEFNKLILIINYKNQTLQNKQNELKACLIQNFEVNDQLNYMQKKLSFLQKEVEGFCYKYVNLKNPKIQEIKAVTVAIGLKKFFDKNFSIAIDVELSNYKNYFQKLNEDSQNLNIANNLDLIVRDKAEEKLITDKSKYENMERHKQKVFQRMQNENTILIAECNRLRKNLHEVYTNVVEIEFKFEHLTKINPGLNKTEIVRQIKYFIKERHAQIKNYNKPIEQSDIIQNTDLVKSLGDYEHTDNLADSVRNLETMRVRKKNLTI